MDLLDFYHRLTAGDMLIALGLLLSLIQIAPLRLDPWTALFGWIGRKMTGDLSKKIDTLEKKIDALEAKEDQRDAVNKRVRILRFEDELQEAKKHSKDSFDQVLSDITDYDAYCESHPKFKNDQTAATVRHIRKVYDERLERRDFL